MIDADIKQNIVRMFIAGAETGQVLAAFPGIGKSTIYTLRREASRIQETAGFTPVDAPPIGIIGDTHLPFEHPRYLEFIKDTFSAAGCEEFVHIGDLFDNHAISYHETNVNGLSAGNEFTLAKERAQAWYDAFKNVYWIEGNYDRLPWRKIQSAGLPKDIIRDNVFGCPSSWKYRQYVILRDVRFSHGIGSAGINGHLNLSKAKGMSVVMGHCHSFGGVAYRANENDLFFGMNVGCGIDIEAYGMEYGKDFPQRPTLGCGLVYSSEYAVFVPMDLRKYSRHV